MSGGIAIITEAIVSILMSRFLLNLRGVYLPNDNSADSPFRPSEITSNLQFASSIIGNLGAPLTHSVKSDLELERENELDWGEMVDTVQESCNPLSVGLESPTTSDIYSSMNNNAIQGFGE
ncbi:hypothetical protein C8Q75DRAFT_808680 [Abortiporus biennis]|nr:hypothetical protein C8Q75DRAFT_808680 [Abortiporus biennis]